MTTPLIQDPKIKDFISRVGEDVSQLKSDVSSLLKHTGRHAIPESARELRNSARERLHAGGEFANSQIRYIREHPKQSSIGLLGGLVLLGAVGAGIYYLMNSDCCGSSSQEVEDDE